MNQENDTPERAEVKKRNPLNSVVWLIPLLALVTGAWLLYQHLREAGGPEVTLYIQNADGISSGDTQIKVLNVAVGKVTDVRIRNDEKGVVLTARLNSDVKEMMRKDTQFWLVKPRIGSEGVSGLNTLVSGVYIAFTPGHSKDAASSFTVEDYPPSTAIGQSGTRLKLVSHSTKLIPTGSPVVYGSIQVGTVEKADFNPDDKSIHYQIFVLSPNDKLLGKNIDFWMQTGLRIEATGGGVNIDSGPVSSLLTGAIAFKERTGGKGPAPAKNDVFTLYGSYRDVLGQPTKRALYYVAFFDSSLRGLHPGAPVEYKGLNIGSVAEVPYFDRNDSHNLFKNGRIPVRLRIEPARMEINADAMNDDTWKQHIANALSSGLTASLETDNLLTGNLYVSLSKAGKDTAVLRPVATYRGDPVIGSRNSGLDKLQEQLSDLLAKFNKLPLDKTVGELNGTLAQLRATLAGADALLKQDSTRRLPENLNKTLAELQKTLAAVSPGSPLYGDIQNTLKQLDKTMKAVQPTLQNLKSKPNSLIFNSGSGDPQPKGSR